MSVQIFIQARVNSTRLPGKVLKKIETKTVLGHIIERAKAVKGADKIIIVTGDKKLNLGIIEEAKKYNIEYFCGSESNVLDRFFQASKKFHSEAILRITADSPLIDFNIMNEGIEIFKKSKIDILCNSRNRTFPHGLDFEIFSVKALEKIWRESYEKFNHDNLFYDAFIPPTKDILDNEKFSKYYMKNKNDLSKIRLTLDFPEDFMLIKKIYEILYPKNQLFVLKDILEVINDNKEILKINIMHTKH